MKKKATHHKPHISKGTFKDFIFVYPTFALYDASMENFSLFGDFEYIPRLNISRMEIYLVYKNTAVATSLYYCPYKWFKENIKRLNRFSKWSFSINNAEIKSTGGTNE